MCRRYCENTVISAVVLRETEAERKRQYKVHIGKYEKDYTTL